MAPTRHWHAALTSQAWRRALFLLACIAPLIAGILSRFQRHSHWFSDYDAVACAGEKLARGEDFYAWPVACSHGMKSSGYVYPPHVARMFEAGAEAIGPDAFKAAYLVLAAISFGFLCWFVFLRRNAPGEFWDRAPGFALVTGSLVYYANIAVPLHALICVAALAAPKRPWLFALALAAAAALKPVYLVYGLVLLVVQAPVLMRLGLGAAAAILGLAPTAAFALGGGRWVEAWRHNLDFFVYGRQPGEGFYGWLSVLGIEERGLVPAAACALFVGALSLAAIVIAVRAKLDGSTRVALGLGIACLVNPRLSANDIMPLALAAGSAIAIARAAELSDRARRGIVALVAGGLCIGGVGNSLDAGDYCVKVCTLMLTAAVLWLAVALARRETGPAAADGVTSPSSA
jgi:hypothetical protein